MTDLRIEQVKGDAALEDWRHVHNVIVPPAAMSPDEVRERAVRHHLEVAYAGDELVGCSTVRPPTDESSTATVIARVLPAHRNQGFGAQLWERGLDRARALDAEVIETVVLATNVEGLRFALTRGFVEIERYVLPGDTVPYIDLRLAPARKVRR
ncbi:GNAT family N-acetyltransferase [Streptomyces sp. NPDC006283]|uniref:GNAT family N-acetyltransferase n=1 Tax=Streptomyces sp. NPDC006283 TaxID=3156741 RepID=UPI0033BEC88C